MTLATRIPANKAATPHRTAQGQRQNHRRKTNNAKVAAT